MSKSEYKRFATQMPEVFKTIRDAALDEAITTLSKEYNALGDDYTSFDLFENADKAIRDLKHD